VIALHVRTHHDLPTSAPWPEPPSPDHPPPQSVWLSQLLAPHTLRRAAAELRPLPPAPVAEVQLPVGVTPYQAEAYKTLLARGYETLADPRPARCVLRSLCVSGLGGWRLVR
jgi:hypothetical protein